MQSPEATGTHDYGCAFGEWDRTSDPIWSLCLCVRLWTAVIAPLCSVRGTAGPSSRGFVWTTGLWCRPWRLVEVDYRAWCPSVLNKRMSRIKRFAVHWFAVNSLPMSETGRRLRSPDNMDESIDSSAPVAPWSQLRLGTDATPNLAATENDDGDI